MKTQVKASDLYYSQTRFLFHCHVKIKIPVRYPESLVGQSFLVLEEIDRRYNSYRPNSFFDLINRLAGQWVEVDDWTIYLLNRVLQISELSGGTYDITAMPLIRLWGFYKNGEKELPGKAAIAETLKRVDYRHIEIQGNRVRIGANQEVTTGSFLKAAAVDQLIDWWKSKGLTDALINAGGSTIAGINDDLHPCWKVNLPNPANYSQKLAVIELQNASFSLSACQRHFLVINGNKYGHILNARTGTPTLVLQTGVRCLEAMTGDLIATALFSTDDNVQKMTANFDRHFDFEAYRINLTGALECFHFLFNE